MKCRYVTIQKGGMNMLLKEVNKLYDNFADVVYNPGTLDAKTKELIALSCSVMADCTPCIEYHLKKAGEAGAEDDQIREALAITLSIAAGSKRAKYGPLVRGLLEKNQAPHSD
jgi:AhpD family alkylhydroperoxidase